MYFQTALVHSRPPCFNMDLTKRLLPSSHLPTDVTFILVDGEVSAHKSILATCHPAFEQIFGAGTEKKEVNWVKVGLNLFFEQLLK